MLLAVLFIWLGLQAPPPPPDPVFPFLDQAYSSLKAKDYDSAIRSFREAIRLAPNRRGIHTDLAYTLLKAGDNLAARDAFREAMLLEPGDAKVAMEYAFLCYETARKADARRIFDRLRRMPGDHQATARQAFENIDRPLEEGIARWKSALVQSDSYSAHEELAKLAEERDDFPLAAEHYAKAWSIRPISRTLLLDFARVSKALGHIEDSMIALLAASRGDEPRTAERARALLPTRYPYVYEFQKALVLDPANYELRRELAYLHLAMGQKAEAESEFERLVRDSPNDLLSAAQLGFLRLGRGEKSAVPLLQKVLASEDDELADRARAALQLPQLLKKRSEAPRAAASIEAKTLADRSLEKGYLRDALKYLGVANENDPVDFSVMLKLGWTHNVLHQDDEAVRWFGLARRAPDAAIAREASQAYRNLRAQSSRFRTTAWMYPFYSTRWKDIFAYGQVKTELRFPTLPVRLYVSTRFIGDTRGATTPTAGLGPQFLSESSVIAGLGLATSTFHGTFAWFEAGEAMKYRQRPTGDRLMTPDYRGGVSFNRGFGQLLSKGMHGLFAETNNDAIFVSRFDNNFLTYSQNRAGYTFAANEAGTLQAQLFGNANVTADVQRQPWANYAEAGPGIRFRLPQGLLITASVLRGVYTVPQGPDRRPNFWDVRVGIWYAFTAVH